MAGRDPDSAEAEPVGFEASPPGGEGGPEEGSDAASDAADTASAAEPPSPPPPPRDGSPEAAGSPSAEGPAPEPDERARRRAELESFLGPKVRTPVGIPLGYSPNDRSIHPLLHVDVDHLDFAGPLDLLLYLIRKHELDVLDIPIAFVTEKYLAMLQTFEALEIDLAAEFLVLASELAHIKSKMLLPADKGVAVDDPPEDEEQGDPRAELVRRLLEHQKYRDAAHQLADRDQLGRDVFPRRPPSMDQVDDLDPGLKQVSVFKLVELMARLLREVPVHHEISFESFSIGERIQYVSAFAEAKDGRFTLQELMLTIASRSELVVTFIAVLEMGKMGLIRISVEAFHDQTFPAPRAPVGASPEPAAPGPEVEPEAGSVGSRSEEGPDTLSRSAAGATEGTRDDLEPGDDLADGVGPAMPDETEAEAARREAAELEALAEEAAAETAVEADAVELPSSGLTQEPPEPVEPLPEIWVELTEKRFQGELDDDYA